MQRNTTYTKQQKDTTICPKSNQIKKKHTKNKYKNKEKFQNKTKNKLAILHNMKVITKSKQNNKKKKHKIIRNFYTK